jgi:hypothetical protein
MLTPQQVKALVYLLIWMANEEGWPGFKLEHDTGTLHQHRWYCATACPSDRINFTEVIRMATDVQGQIAIINLADRWMAMIKLGQLQQVINEAKAMGVVAQ